jgi:hypothetical protein
MGQARGCSRQILDILGFHTSIYCSRVCYVVLDHELGIDIKMAVVKVAMYEIYWSPHALDGEK